MTGNSKQQRADALAITAEEVQALRSPISLQVRQYLEDMRTEDADRLAGVIREVSEAIDIDPADIFDAARRKRRLALAADLVASASVEEIERLTAKATHEGIAGLTYNQLFILALILVISMALGIIVPDLPQGMRDDLGTDTGIIGVALFLADKAAKRKS